MVQREQVANPAPLGARAALTARCQAVPLLPLPCCRPPAACSSLQDVLASPPPSLHSSHSAPLARLPSSAGLFAFGYTTALLQGANTAIAEASTSQMAAW